jgi:hypothetical protein
VQRLLPDAEFVALPDCGHLAMWDDPPLVAQTILDVTHRVDGGSTAPDRPLGSRPSG